MRAEASLPTVPVQRVDACPVCGACNRRGICSARDRQHALSDQSFVYSRCGSCGVVYQSLRPVESGIATFYPDDYGPYQSGPMQVRADQPSRHQGPHFAAARRQFHRWMIALAARLNRTLERRYPDRLPRKLEAAYSPPRTGAVFLDYGCGSADALDRAKARGWVTIGVDFLEPIVEAVRQAGHRGLLCDDKLWSAIPDGSVDLIRMNHVIEHLYHPHETFRRLRSKLRLGGILHLATPNADSVTFRVLRQHWFPLECPRHIVIYTPRAARGLLRAAGFAHVECFQEILTKDTARSVGYWLQDRGRTDTAGALQMMHRPDLAALLFAPARLAALRGAADRFHAFAVA
jgi:SAM-dependent methyltransferase